MAPPGPRHPPGALLLGDLACNRVLSPLADLSNSGVRRKAAPRGWTAFGVGLGCDAPDG